VRYLYVLNGYYDGWVCEERVNRYHRTGSRNPRLCGRIGSISLVTTEIPVEQRYCGWSTTISLKNYKETGPVFCRLTCVLVALSYDTHTHTHTYLYKGQAWPLMWYFSMRPKGFGCGFIHVIYSSKRHKAPTTWPLYRCSSSSSLSRPSAKCVV